MSDSNLEIEIKDNYWRNTGRYVTILGVHCFVLVPFLFFIFSFSLFWLLILIATAIFLFVTKHFGYTPIVFYRLAISQLAGSRVRRDRRIGNHKIW